MLRGEIDAGGSFTDGVMWDVRGRTGPTVGATALVLPGGMIEVETAAG